MQRFKIPLTSSLLLLCMFSFAKSATATVFSIDEFTVARGDGTVIFRDSFDNGIPPPSAPNFLSNGNSASYALTGAAGTEANGSYSYDTANGQITDAVGRPGFNRVSDARLLTNIDNANNDNGLKGGNTFIVSGLFNLGVLPTLPREGFGIRLSDGGIIGGTGNDIIDLFVRQTSLGELVVEFRRIDVVADTITSFGRFAYEAGHDQILLQLSKLDASTKTVQAGFAYVDGVDPGDFTTFATTADIFNGENATRASFRATTPIPVAPTLSLTLLGLVSMFAMRKKNT